MTFWAARLVRPSGDSPDFVVAQHLTEHGNLGNAPWRVGADEDRRFAFAFAQNVAAFCSVNVAVQRLRTVSIRLSFN